MHEAARVAPDIAEQLLEDLDQLAAKLFRAGGAHVCARSQFGPLEVAALPDSRRGLIAAGCEIADLVARTRARASVDDRAESGAGEREVFGLRRSSAPCSNAPNSVGAIAAKLFRVGGSRISVRSRFTPLVIAALPDNRRAYIAIGCELADLADWPELFGPRVSIEARPDAEHAAVRGLVNGVTPVSQPADNQPRLADGELTALDKIDCLMGELGADDLRTLQVRCDVAIKRLQVLKMARKV